MATKTAQKKVSVEDFVQGGSFTNRRGKPVSASYIYRLIRQHHKGEREKCPVKYIMEGDKDRIFILLP